jgi:Kef-type K+ transport system membrane component KefB
MSLSVAFVLLTVGLSMVTFDIGPMHCGFSLLLVCMMTGTVFCNICPTSDELMDRLDRWVSPVNILFFVLSGAELDLNILSDPLVLLIGVVYIAFRSLGKISGAFPLQPQHPEVPRHHPAAAGWRGAGHGSRGR